MNIKKVLLGIFLLSLLGLFFLNFEIFMNIYQNYFYKRVCTNKFCIKKPKNYLVASVVNNGNLEYTLIYHKPKINFKNSDNFILLFKTNDRNVITIDNLDNKKIIKLNKFIKKFRPKKDKYINNCYNFTEKMNREAKLNDRLYLLCPNEKISISSKYKDYKTIKNIIDSFECIDKNEDDVAGLLTK